MFLQVGHCSYFEKSVKYRRSYFELHKRIKKTNNQLDNNKYLLNNIVVIMKSSFFVIFGDVLKGLLCTTSPLRVFKF